MTNFRGRRTPVVAGAVAAMTGIALAATPPSTAAPDRTGTDGHHHVEGPGFHPGGIDGAVLRHRLIHERPGTTGPSARAERVREEGGKAVTRLPRPREDNDWQLRVNGDLDTEPAKKTRIAPSKEDDGSIPLARRLRLDDARPGISTSGRIGDGPHGSGGSATGDYDFYGVRAKTADTLTVDVQLAKSVLLNAVLYNADGEVVNGSMIVSEDGRLHFSHPVTRPGRYYVAIGSYFPEDPFDPGSGAGASPQTETPYDLSVTRHSRRTADTDVYAVPLREGDVVGAAVNGSARRVALRHGDGSLVQSANTNPGALYPATSPLPRTGHAAANHVVDRDGMYLVEVSDGSGPYSLTVGAHPAPSTTGDERQTVLLDFSGPTFDNRVFGASVTDPGRRTVSPMRAFLPRWGMTGADERAVIEATTKRVRQVLRHDIPGSRIRVVSSLTHPGLFGRPGVSRVIIGGTVKEAGVMPAFGLAQSVDPGNFAREETALVMPERMSGDGAMSLTQFMTANSDRVKAVGQALGNTTAHEIGHFIGNYHTDDFADETSVMNTGNRLNMFALGDDGVAGTRDDWRLGMRVSSYDMLQGILGVEDTPRRTGVALR